MNGKRRANSTGGGKVPRPGADTGRKKKPKQYRRHINNFKDLKKNGIGGKVMVAGWKPETFRDYIEGWRLMVVMNTAVAVGLVLYILYRIFLK